MLSKILANPLVRNAFFLSASAAMAGTVYLLNKRHGTHRPHNAALAGPKAKFVDELHQNYLTDRAAAIRSKAIQNGRTDYQLFVKLLDGPEYEGLVNIQLDVKDTDHDLFVDFDGKEVVEVTVNNVRNANGEPLKNFWDKKYIVIPQNVLHVGRNTIEIHFRTLYSTSGNGFHKFTDVDKKSYVFSHLEPYHCNKMFPCLDQPDLKGKFGLQVVAPSDWQVVSNQKPASKRPLGDYLQSLTTGPIAAILKDVQGKEFNYWQFQDTKPLSTYLYAIIAGPYVEFKCDNTYNSIDMSLYSRSSLADSVKQMAPFFFETTIEGIKFYEKKFGYKFPFQKYDQIFCPEFNMGAMENPGAITFNELYIWRENPPTEKKTRLANTILHELAHMWFGDLVTMKWWDDLWLNESFADFISHYCQSHVTPNIKSQALADPWMLFFRRKTWAYREDQLSTTHPIACEAHNTEEAETNFDGITYAKGASVLKQLLFLLGAENFSKGLHHYFNKYAWSNATLADFLDSMQQALPAGVDLAAHPELNLQTWRDSWLKTAGLNECIPEWNPQGTSAKESIKIIQTAAIEAHTTLRYHKIKVAFFDNEGNIYKTSHIVVKNQSTTEFFEDFSQRRPSAILLNFEDEAYMKILLDQASLSYFLGHLNKIKSDFTRAQIWISLWNMVRDGKMSAVDYCFCVMDSLSEEPLADILSTMLRYAEGAVGSFIPKELDKKHRVKERLYERVLSQIKKEAHVQATEKVLLLKEFLISFACTDEHYDTLAKWLDGTLEALKKVEIGRDSKWSIVVQLHRSKKLTNEQKAAYLERVAAEDKSDRAVRIRRRCEAIVATTEKRKELWASFLDESNKESVHSISESMSGFNDSSNLERSEAYVQPYFNELVKVYETRDREYANHFYDYLHPRHERFDESLTSYQELLKKTPESQIPLVRRAKESIDDLKRRKKAFACCEANTKHKL